MSDRQRRRSTAHRIEVDFTREKGLQSRVFDCWKHSASVQIRKFTTKHSFRHFFTEIFPMTIAM
jgi:hypothetical protein